MMSPVKPHKYRYGNEALSLFASELCIWALTRRHLSRLCYPAHKNIIYFLTVCKAQPPCGRAHSLRKTTARR